MPKEQYTVDCSYVDYDNPVTIHITVSGKWPGTKAITDCLNKHMPEPKKNLEDFMGLSNTELNALTKTARGSLNTGIHYMHNESFYYSYLRPEMKRLRYHVDLRVDDDLDVEFRLYRNGTVWIKSITESPENPPARIYTIFYLLVKELTR